MNDEVNKRMDSLTKLVGWSRPFTRLVDFPEKGYTQNMIEWAVEIKEQTRKAIAILKAEKSLPSIMIEDQNLLNYLEALMGQDFTPFPRKVSVQTHQSDQK